jgi:AGCS family alanine or glycine:cation symporter
MISFRSELPEAIALIFSSAFSGQAAFGGFLGSTVMMGLQVGIARSIFSSEAGLGISSIAAAAAKTASSGRQALLSMTATLMSTAVICTITAIVIAVTGVMGSVGADGRLVNGASLAIEAFSSAMPTAGNYIVAFGLILFAFTTVIAWAYYGEKCVEYIAGERFVIPYRVLYTILIIPGSVFALETIWNFADAMNALMVIPNMIALLALSGVIQKETKDFFQQQQSEKGKKALKEAALETLVAGES